LVKLRAGSTGIKIGALFVVTADVGASSPES
jgi:hypothetical protein